MSSEKFDWLYVCIIFQAWLSTGRWTRSVSTSYSGIAGNRCKDSSQPRVVRYYYLLLSLWLSLSTFKIPCTSACSDLSEWLLLSVPACVTVVVVHAMPLALLDTHSSFILWSVSSKFRIVAHIHMYLIYTKFILDILGW